MSVNPVYRKTKKYTNQLAEKIFTIDDARNIVIKIKQLEGLTKNSIDNYEKLFNDFDQFFGEKTDVSSLTSDDARNFIHWQLNEKIQFKNHKYRKSKPKGVSVSSVNTYLSFAKSTFNVLVSEEIVEDNIFDDLKNVKDKEKKIETLTIDEIKKLLRAMNKGLYSDFRAYVIVHVLLDSFGRIDEVLSLKKTDVDFDAQSLTFQKTKSGKIRIVPLSKKVLKLIEELNEETEEFDSEYIFLTNHGKPLTPPTFRKHFNEIVNRSGINRRVNLHLFRHTASEMFLRGSNGQGGGSIRVLQKILGHSDLSVTQQYAHVLDNTIKNQHAQFSPLNLIEEKDKRKTKRKGATKR